MRFNGIVRAGLLALLALVALPAIAEQSVRSGDVVVHYSAVPTTSLSPEVARHSGITRSANRALVNVAIRQGQAGADRALPGQVQIVATNLSGQRSELRAREVREADAIYYLAEARTAGTDTLAFEIEVLPEGATAPIRIQFTQEFFPQ
jgi:hypothetical protein